MKHRFKALKLLVIVAVAVIGIRLFLIQIIEHDAWVKAASKQQVMRDMIVAERGEIYMMDDDEPTPVVMNATVWTVLVDPMEANPKKTEKLLDEVIKPKLLASWEKVFEDRTRRYFVVAKNVMRKEAETIKKANLKGVWMQEGTKRVYPEGEMGSRLLGFVNADGTGQYGVEGAFDKDLKGKNGLLKTVKDVNNIPLTIGKENVRVPAQDGKKIVLSIDRNIQRNTEKILAESIKASRGDKASAIVMNPRNGQILAMADLPNYQPENYGNVKGMEDYQNNVLVDAYEPASILKAFTFAAAIDTGAMKPDSVYENTGKVYIEGWPIENAYKGQIGTVSMQTALDFSLNTGSIQALRWLSGSSTDITARGRQKLYEYYHDKFGLGQRTGVELAESAGMLVGPNTGDGRNARYANMTFGQNLNVTMVQVAAAFSSLVNGGHYYTPTVVAGEVKDEVGFVKAKPRKSVRTVVNESTSSTMREMLYGVRKMARLRGTDRPGYYVGGKTGTAQVIRDGKYIMEETIASYAGFGGIEDELPEYVIMVRILGDGRQMSGEADALPIFNQINNYMLDYLKIKPKETL